MTSSDLRCALLWLLAGGLTLGAAVWLFGPWVTAGFAALAIADSVWCWSRLPARWRPW